MMTSRLSNPDKELATRSAKFRQRYSSIGSCVRLMRRDDRSNATTASVASFSSSAETSSSEIAARAESPPAPGSSGAVEDSAGASAITAPRSW
jgi:hypothetical protein